MGMFDSTYVDCPTCGFRVEFQSKEGPLCLNAYNLEDAPTEVLVDIINDPHWCRGCKSWFALVDPDFPPEQRRPNPKAVPVRDPKEDEFWAYQRDPDRLRWWNAPFTFADLATPTSQETDHAE